MVRGRTVGEVDVSERSMMGVSAFYRAVSLISSELASLPLRSYTQASPEVIRKQVPSIFDDPDGPDGQTPFEWKCTLFAHLIIHGKAGALKIKNNGGAVIALRLVPPGSFKERVPTSSEIKSKAQRPRGGLWFDLTLDTGEAVKLDADDFFYVPGLSLDGLTGVSLLEYARVSMGTTISADEAAGNMFANGAMISGIATPDDEEDITDDVPEIRRQIESATGGYENAGRIAVIARRLKLQPWSMTAVDAQFLQSRQFQIEEIARWTGVPPHLLMQTEKQTSWGTGVEMQDRALGRTVLSPWAHRAEQRGSRLLAKPRFLEFDFSGLERPAPEKEVEIDLAQVAAGVMTKDEYRKKRGWSPLPKSAQEPAADPDTDDDPEADDDGE